MPRKLSAPSTDFSETPRNASRPFDQTRDDGGGARRAMEIALRQAGVSDADVQHLNAHATSTPMGDRSELRATLASQTSIWIS